MPAALYIGLMSGTSMDGIDAALVDFSGDRPVLIDAITHPWPASQAKFLRELAGNGKSDLKTLGRLDAACGNCFADAALALLGQNGLSARDVAAIGSHGQTLHHAPDGEDGFSLQVGDPSRIAERTGITTVADFRQRDIAAGGQGAPLVPAFHLAWLHDPTENRAVLNIGGIANLTLLPANEPASGFDTGPGNCLMDAWIATAKGEPYDKKGAWAACGRVNEPLLADLLDDGYFRRHPPKSTGTQHFSLGWLENRLAAHPDVVASDIQATLAALTVRSIQAALAAQQPDSTRLLVCGGGLHNDHLIGELAAALPGILIESTGEYGLDPDQLEAMAFAWLARQTLRGQPGNLPVVTGARRPVILGGIYPA